MTFDTQDNTQAENLLTEGTDDTTAPTFDHRGTYSPEDNKLRLYPSYRLERPLYDRLKQAGFKWAPKQELFVAPMWTPFRNDLLIELCGDIEDEDTSLVERAETRADRFENYETKRRHEGDRTYTAARSLAGNIPFGQPILVGHHSERRARKDAEKITNGYSRALKLWDTADYWTSRAAGAVQAAKYKEVPAVRYRRMKGLEADKRKQEKQVTESKKFIAFFSLSDLSLQQALKIAGCEHTSYYFTLEKYPRKPPISQYEGAMSIYSALKEGIISVQQAAELTIKNHTRYIAHAERWIAHYDNRIAYEKAMLQESGGVSTDKFNLEIGGKVKVRGEWHLIKRLNHKDGVIVSVTTTARYVPVRGVEEIKEYIAPTAEEVAKVKAATKIPPLCNYPDAGMIEVTKAEWENFPKDYRGTEVIKSTDTHGAHRVRSVSACFLPADKRTGLKQYHWANLYITDTKRVDAPKIDQAASAEPVAPLSSIEKPLPDPRPIYQKPEPTTADLVRDQLKHGVKAVSANQLFVTQPELATRMAEIADIKPGDKVREPSAGTGNIVRAIASQIDLNSISLSLIEINADLASMLAATFPAAHVTRADFMECSTAQTFDKILMNPPFADGQDIKHIKHALTMLNKGGTLVAICAAGPKQKEQLLPIVEQFNGVWEPLPADTFAASGTHVNTILLTIST